MRRVLSILIVAMSMISTAFAAQKYYTVVSPDGTLKATIAAGENLNWSLAKNNVAVLSSSRISMTLTDGTVFGGNAEVAKTSTKSVDKTINTVVYKKAVVEDKYNQLTLKFKNFDLEVRMYNEAAAYRFISKLERGIRIAGEQAEFMFPSDYKAFIPYVKDSDVLSKEFDTSFESLYQHIPLSEWNKDKIAFLPITVQAGDYTVCITESDLLNYPGMYLYNSSYNADDAFIISPETESATGMRAVFAPYPAVTEQGGHNNLQKLVKETEGYIAKASAGASFPWRIVNVASDDKDLLNNDMVYKLGTPAPADEDYSWVKPGKVAWDWWNDWNIYGVDFMSGINNDTYKYYIDFASKHGIEYVILDEGWAVNMKADLFEVVPEINLKELITYAKQKNVDIILWAGFWAFDRDMEKVCKTYSEMGVKGFKVDFMNRDDQEMVAFYTRAAKMCAKYHLLVDFHGAFKPAGLQRRYPNVINYEGVHGLENMKWESSDTDQVTYDVTIPYTRMVAGSFDYTQGAMRNATRADYAPSYSSPMSQGTRCHQLAEYVIFESPLNMLCDSPSNYMKEKECTEFISAIPTTWDETVAVDGKIAEYAAIARKKGDTWYVGALNNWTERDLELNLGFVPSGNYDLIIYKDGVNADKAAQDFAIEKIAIPFNRKLNIHMAPGGGWVAKIVKR